MHESLRSLRPAWIAFGWFIAASLTSLMVLALEAFDILSDSPAETFWIALSLLLSFFIAGFFVGTRVAAAPILHGLAIGLFSVLVWIGLNLFLGEPTGGSTWRDIDPTSLAEFLVLQGTAVVVGTRVGVRWVRRERPELRGNGERRGNREQRGNRE